MLTTHNEQHKLLVRPNIESGESLSGFGLRIAEDNGYPSMHVLLSYSGIDEKTLRSDVPPVDILSKLLNRNYEKELAYLNKSKNKKHRLIYDQEVSTIYLNHKKPRICPECVKEHNYVKILFDLNFYLGCSKHNKQLLSHCAICKTHVSWNRPGILKCKCNLVYDATNLPELDPAIAGMMALLEWKFERPRLNSEKLIELGYPIELLDNLDSSILLYAIKRLLKKPFLHIRNSTFNDPIERSLEAFHHMFKNWPLGFYEYMEAHVEDNKSSLLSKKFSTFYRTFCITGQQTKPIEFLHNAFIEFGNSHWKKSTIDARSLSRANIEGEVMGVYGLANRLSLRLPTILNYIEKKIIKGHDIEDNDGTTTIFYLDEMPFKPWNGKCYEQRDAAAYLQITVRLFRVLQKLKIFKKEHFAYGLRGFAEIDLDNFLKSFNIPSTRTINKYSQKIMLKSILARKNINLEFVAHLLQEVRIGKIVANFENVIPEMTFDVADINQFCYENKFTPFAAIDSRNLDLF